MGRSQRTKTGESRPAKGIFAPDLSSRGTSPDRVLASWKTGGFRVSQAAMTLIAEPGALAAFCRRQHPAEFVAIDTEFMRDKTYWPQLCLVQVAGPQEAAAIDTLAPGIDLDPLLGLLADSKLLKVFH